MVIVPGKPAESLVIQAVKRTHEKIKMPPNAALQPEAVAALEELIQRGAVFPEAAKPARTRLVQVPVDVRKADIGVLGSRYTVTGSTMPRTCGLSSMTQHRMPLQSVADAHAFLEQIGACGKLLRHAALVGEAAELLLMKLRDLGLPCDEQFVRLGVALHDAGKIVHPDELRGPGNQHEPAGEQLLLAHSVEARLARVCLSHARWSAMDCTFEELLVAMADTLWKGKRSEDLETRLINAIVERSSEDRWELFIAFDSCFESIAAGGEERLGRS